MAEQPKEPKQDEAQGLQIKAGGTGTVTNPKKRLRCT